MAKQTQTVAEQWDGFTPEQKRRRCLMHYNGTCRCYGERGAVIPGSRETGKSCIVPNLSGHRWEESRAIIKTF